MIDRQNDALVRALKFAVALIYDVVESSRQGDETADEILYETYHYFPALGGEDGSYVDHLAALESFIEAGGVQKVYPYAHPGWTDNQWPRPEHAYKLKKVHDTDWWKDGADGSN